jgi:hypothetical protein
MNPKLDMKVGLLCGCLLAAVSGCSGNTTPVSGASPATSTESAAPILAPKGTYGGKTYAEWGSSWFQWQLELPGPLFPMQDRTGAHCGDGQDGTPTGSPVFYLVGAAGTVTRTCTIPANRMLFIPLASWLADNVGVPEGAALSDRQLEDILYRESKTVSEVSLDVDGVPLVSSVSDVMPYFTYATQFSYLLPETPFNFMATFENLPASGQVPVSFNGGVWILLAPLPPGPHTIHFEEASVASPFGPASSMAVTYEIDQE